MERRRRGLTKKNQKVAREGWGAIKKRMSLAQNVFILGCISIIHISVLSISYGFDNVRKRSNKPHLKKAVLSK